MARVRVCMLGNGDCLVGKVGNESLLSQEGEGEKVLLVNPVLYKLVSGVFPAPPRIQGGPVAINPACLPTLIMLPVPSLTVTGEVASWEGDEQDPFSQTYLTFINANESENNVRLSPN